MDPGYHNEWARAILDGEDFAAGEPFFRAPGYSYFLAALFSVTGRDLYVTRILQSLLGVASLLLIFLIGKHVFDEAVALGAVLLAILYPMFIYFHGELLITPLALTLNLLLIWLILMAEDRKERRIWFAAGLVLGLSAITRPNVLVFSPFIPLWLIMQSKKETIRRVVLPTAIVAIASLLVILPVTIRNLTKGGELVLIAWQGGVNFYLGNHSGADGWSATAPEFRRQWQEGYEDAISIPQSERGSDLSYKGISNYWFEKGGRFIRENPGQAARLFLKKTYLLLHAEELSNNYYIPYYARHSLVFRLLPFGMGLMMPLGLIGAFWSRNRSGARLLMLFFLSYSATLVLFFVCSRFRMPVVPVLLLFSSSALSRMWQLSRRNRKRLLPPLAILLLLATLLTVDFGAVDKINLAWAHQGEGGSLYQQGRIREAEEKYRDAIRTDPDYPEGYYGLGTVLQETERPEEALAAFQAYLKLGENKIALNSVARLLESLGRFGEADIAFRHAIARFPDYPNFKANYALFLEKRSRYGEAVTQWEAYLGTGAFNPIAPMKLGECLIKNGQEVKGERRLREALRQTPEFADTAIILARHLAKTNRIDEALAVLTEAIQQNQGNVNLRALHAELSGGTRP